MRWFQTGNVAGLVLVMFCACGDETPTIVLDEEVLEPEEVCPAPVPRWDYTDGVLTCENADIDEADHMGMCGWSCAFTDGQCGVFVSLIAAEDGSGATEVYDEFDRCIGPGFPICEYPEPDHVVSQASNGDWEIDCGSGNRLGEFVCEWDCVQWDRCGVGLILEIDRLAGVIVPNVRASDGCR